MTGALGNSINRLRSATKAALDRNRHALGSDNSGDSQLKTYEKLRPQDFELLAARYGGDGVLRYIQHMEARKARTQLGV
jgi:hypothetical protein